MEKPRASVPSTTPSTPSGTTSSTENGIDQLSYSAARHRNTASSEKPNRYSAVAPASRSSRDCPVHSKPKPGGNCPARRSISAIASPVLTPGAASPAMRIVG